MFLGSTSSGFVQQLSMFNCVVNPVRESKIKFKKDVVKHEKVKHELTLIPKMSIHPNQVNLYHEVNWSPSRPVRNVQQNEDGNYQVKYEHLLESGRTAAGQVSKIAKRKISRALDYMLLITNNKTIHNNFTGRNFKFKIAFVTLTLPATQIHTDNEIKEKCLNQLLIELKKVYKVKNYIWRAEKQRNGNLHFHLLVDKFIPHQELRDRWNRCIEKLSYITRYRETQVNWHKNGFRVREELLKTWSKEKQYQAYLRGSSLQWNSPNSTDIHSVYKIHNIKLYVSKYLSKDPFKIVAALRKQKENIEPLSDTESALISKLTLDEIEYYLSLSDEDLLKMQQEGRIWSCNQELSNIKGCQADVSGNLSDECHKLEKSENVKVFKDTYFTSIMLNSAVINPNDFPLMFKLFSNYLLETFDFYLQLELSY